MTQHAQNTTFSAREVASRLWKALHLPVPEVALARADLPDDAGEGPGTCWNVDQIEEAAIKKSEGR